MLNNLTIRLRLMLLSGLMIGFIVITNVIGLVGINSSNDNVEIVYTNRLMSIKSLSFIKSSMQENRRMLLTAYLFKDKENESKKAVSAIEKNLDDAKKQWEIYKASPSDEEENKLADKCLSDLQSYTDEALRPIIEKIKTGDFNGLPEIIYQTREKFIPANNDIEALIQYNDNAGKAEYQASVANFKMIFSLLAGIVFLVLIIAFILGNKITASILNSLTAVQDIANSVAHGDLTSRINTDIKDETRPMLQAMQAMQNTIVRFIDAQQIVTQRHKEGFIYEEIDASKFQGSYADMANSMNSLVRSHIDVKMHIVDVVSQYAKGDFKRDIDRLPGEKAKITAAIDSVKTALLGVNTEIEMLVSAGAQGDFSKRANANKYDFMFKSMLSSLNTLIETCDVGFNDVLRVANALAEGDLTQSITRDYPGVFGQAKIGMNNTTENLKNVMAEIRETTDVISSAAKEIAAGNNDLSHRTEEQAASLEETAASMQELTSTVQHNSENAKQANILAVGATETANRGVAVVEQVVSTMENINESSLRIVDIISVIDDIAFQTNILALNAAVEAARAGEQGKGFAVVAIEVRNLAQRAANAAGEIKRLIGDSVERVSGGSKQVAIAGETMQEIVNAIQGVTSIITEIASASSQQSAGIAQVGQAIAAMDDVTQQNAAMVEEIAASSEALEAQTGHLTTEMSHFKTGNNVGGQRSVNPMTPAKSKPTVVKSTPVSIPKESKPKATFTAGNDDWEEF